MSCSVLRLSAAWPRWIPAFVLLVGAWQSAAAQCPKVLMFDGINVKTEAGTQQASYWGRAVGVQGVFVSNVMGYWQADVGTDPDSKLWQQARLFQSNYAKYGVTDNFIKVALYKPHDWTSARQNSAIIEHFAHAAALARYAGFKGMALDLEPYTPTWVPSADGTELASTVEREGRGIGQAMFAAYPDMTLIVMPDVLDSSDRYRTVKQKLMSGLHQLKSGTLDLSKHDTYELAVPFLRGLLSVPWRQVVIGIEQTYSRNSDGIVATVPQVRQLYTDFMQENGASQTAPAIATGLWPLGRTSADKSARESPERFAERLRVAFDVSNDYVWIYGKGGTWQAGDQPDTAPPASNFQQFVDAIHQVRAGCAAPNATRGYGSPAAYH